MQALRLAVLIGVTTAPATAQQADPSIDADMFSGLRLRSIGPAVKSGRIGDVAIDPDDRSVWYVATASSNV